MKSLRMLLCIALGTLLISLAGCCCGGGTDTETTVIEKQPVSVAPLGEELIKLKEAHEKGALSDEEYEAARQKLLKQ